MRLAAVVLVLAAVTTVSVAAAAPGRKRARQGEAAAEIGVFFAPPTTSAAVEAARAALAARLRALGIAWLDRSPAAASPPEAPERHRRAVEAYQALRFPEALAELDAAVSEVARTGGDGLSPAELSDLFLYRALTRTQRGDTAPAWDDLVAAATIDPSRLLDPAQFPPRAVESFQRAKDAVALASRGAVTIAAPDGCAVAIDGRAGAVTAALPYGAHYARVVCPGRVSWGGVVTVAAATQSIPVVTAAESPPTAAALVALAGELGAASVIAMTVGISADGSATLQVRRVGADGQVDDAVSVALVAGAASSDAREALDRVLAPVTIPIGPDPLAPTPWYRRPWLWAAAGAALATAVILPLTLGDSAASDVILRPSGLPP